MNDRTRRLVAYVAGRMILDTEGPAIVDVETGVTSQFEGSVGKEGADLTELEEQSRIQAQPDGRAFLLTDDSKRLSVRFFLNQNRFYGWDLTTDSPFFGHADDDGIILGEPQVEQRYHYVI